MHMLSQKGSCRDFGVVTVNSVKERTKTEEYLPSYERKLFTGLTVKKIGITVILQRLTVSLSKIFQLLSINLEKS